MGKEDVLQDHLREGLNVVFCGTAAGVVSASLGAYYAGPGNAFWRVLRDVGLTPDLVEPEKWASLNNYGIGLTDVAKKSSGPDSKHSDDDFDPDGFRCRIAEFKPHFVAFNGKKAASVVLGKKTREIAYGLQAETIGDSKIFVLPSTSGAARRFWNSGHWQNLSKMITEPKLSV